MQKISLDFKTFYSHMEIIKSLEMYRLENRISQQDLAEEIGVAFSTISQWFNSTNKPNKIQQYHHIEKFLKNRNRPTKR